MFFIKMQEHT